MKISKNGNNTAKNRSFSAAEATRRTKQRLSDYKNYAGLKDTDKVAEENFDDYALNRVSRQYSIPVEALKKELLATEAVNAKTLEDVANAKADIENPNVVKETGQIENILDWALDYNLEQKEAGLNNYQNVLLIGEAGTGKSSRVKAWAKANNINLVTVRAAGMDDTDLGGAMGISKSGDTVQRLASTEFDDLNEPNSVLFLDEYNRAPKTVRTNLLELINSHEVPDPRVKGGQRVLDNFLFTVAAINPANANYDTDVLDMAERTRFRNVNVQADPENLLNHLTKTLDHMIEVAKTPERKLRAEGRKALAQALLSPDSGLEFDSQEDVDKLKEEDPDGLALNARTLTELIMGSDGTKADLLNKWNEYTNRFKKADAKRILSNYVDITDKANAAIGVGGKSEKLKKPESTFSQAKTTSEKMIDMLDSMGL